jgi:hypothetical protein
MLLKYFRLFIDINSPFSFLSFPDGNLLITNITTIKYFEKAKDEDFLQYGSSAKNLYLLLLEDL